MANRKTVDQQIREYVENPELRLQLTQNSEFASLLEAIENTYISMEQEIKTIEQTLNYRTRAYNYSQQLLTKQNQEISHRAYHDSLTGLPNREYLLERLEASILQSHRNNTPFALLFADLDEFKSVNDIYGHDYGDQVLQQVAKRLRTVIRETDTIARLAGDEFCILLMNVDSPAHSARVAQAIFRQFKKPLQIKEHTFQIAMSVGISHYPEDGKTTSTLLKNADIAMYEAKQKGSNKLQFYEKRLTEQVTQRLEFEKDLAKAIEKEQLKIRLQPQLQTRSGNLIGATATLFWEHPVRGQIDSKYFYDVATDNRLLLPVFEWLLEQCCGQIQFWQKHKQPPITISVPVDSRQFLHKLFIKSVVNILSAYPQSNNFLEILVSEDVIVSDKDLAMGQFRKLNKLGLKTALSQCRSGLIPTEFFKQASIQSLHLDKNLIQEMEL